MKPAEEYILNQAEPFRSIIFNLQIVIENQIPELELLYKWRMPFYYYKGKPFCFINVNHKKKFVDLGIVKGFQLTIYHDRLVSENRKKKKTLRYYSLNEIDNDVLTAITKELFKL